LIFRIKKASKIKRCFNLQRMSHDEVGRMVGRMVGR